MTTLIIAFLVTGFILAWICVLIQKGTIMAQRAELKELKKWMDRTKATSFWHR